MIVLVCGSRDWTDARAVYDELKKLPTHSTIRHGGARGADAMAGFMGERLGHHVEIFEAQWATYGKRAGFLRNVEMLETAPVPWMVLAFKAKPVSPGTDHTIREARRRGIPTRIITPGAVSVEDWG